MPTVPRISRQVTTQALPGARRTAAETALSTGAGVEVARARKFDALGDIGGTLGRAAQGLSQIAIQEREKADNINVLEKSNELAKGMTQLLWDPTTGAMTRQGKDAFDLPEKVSGEYNKLADSLEASLQTPAQKQKFRAQRLEREVNLDLTIQRHVAQQMQAFDASETQKAQENHVQLAIGNANDPRMVGFEMNKAIEAAKGFASRNGVGKEVLEAQVLDITTKTHAGVIEQLLAQDNTRAAAVYFEESKDQIAGDRIAKIEAAIQVGKAKKEGQTRADAILAKGGTLTEQREEARKIDDPDVRDNVMARLEHEAGINDRVKRENEESNLTRAYQIVDTTKSVDGIPAALRAELATHMPALRAYALQRARGVPPITDDKTFYSLMDLAGYKPEEFATKNLLAVRNKLDDGAWEKLVGLQHSIRTGNSKAADHELEGFRTQKEILDDSLRQYGLDPNTKDSDQQGQIAQLRRMVDLRVQAAQQPDSSGKRRKVSETELQETIDNIFGQQVHREGRFSDLFWGGLPAWRNGTDKRLLDYTISDIPADQKADLEKALRAKGRAVTEPALLNLFLEMQVK